MPDAEKRLSRAFASRFTPHVSRTPIMFEDLNDLYQQVILDHCRKPRNFHEMPQATCSAQGHNPLCGDQLKLFLALDGDTIKDISFVGSGCCISKASASLLTEFAKGKTKADVEKMFGQVHEMVTTGNVLGDVGKLAVFAGVYKFPARVKCAILSWHAVMAALKGDAKPVSTENEQT
jgi:nitrogen fixation protein NifU and related proteins